jgi:hypothetical protein
VGFERNPGISDVTVNWLDPEQTNLFFIQSCELKNQTFARPVFWLVFNLIYSLPSRKHSGVE